MLAEKGKARCLRKIILSDASFGMFVAPLVGESDIW